MSKAGLVLITVFAIAAMFMFTRSESEIDRKAREEAAINAGRMTHPATPERDSPAARAAAVEAAAEAADTGPLAPECALARERLAQDQEQLRAQATDLEADLDSLADRIGQAQAWIAVNCRG
jgi:hypothetical protein